MFIEKLRKEQLCEFFNTNNLAYFISKNMCEEENYLYVSIDWHSLGVNYRLYDFEGSTISNENEWRKFLYKIYGEEYRQEYEKYLQRIIENKLSYLK